MGMTKQESATRAQIADHLGKQGHQTYAEYLMLFELHFMSDREAESGAIAYMIPNKGMIFINKDIADIDVIDFLLRHEMLHEYLKHGDRYKKIMQKKHNLKDDEEPTFTNPAEARAWHKLHNMAADWEISKYYSHEKDFLLAKNIPYKDTFVAGLVLELDHPEWLKLTYEEIFEKLEDQLEQIKKELEKQQASSSMERRSVEQQAEDMEEQAGELEQEVAEMEKQLSQKANSGEAAGKSKKQKAEESELEEKIKELKQKAEQLKNQAEELKKDSENSSAAFADPGGDAERKERLDKIKKFWDTLENETKLAKELENQLYDDQRAQSVKQKQQADRNYINNLSNATTLAPMRQFVLDLNNTLKKQISSKNKSVMSFTKKPRSASAISGIYRPGEKITPVRKKNKPTIQVIYDRSGSWSPPKKTAAGDAALSTIKKKYVDKGLINLEVFYCSGGPVTNDRAKADAGGAGMNGVAVIDHLIKTKPDNVIIMTDSDPDYFTYDKVCRINGAAWFLFYDSVAPTFAAHVKAKSKKYYDLKNIEGLRQIIKDPDNK